MGNITNGTCTAVRAGVNNALMAYNESFNLDLQYYYARNVKQILTFDSMGDLGVTFTGGTYNTSCYKTGDASRGFSNSAGPQILEASWSSPINLKMFPDGGGSNDDDFICLVVYTGGVAPDSIIIGLSTSQANYNTQKFETTINQPAMGYSFYQFAKPAFTKTGTGFDWDSVSYLKLQYTGGDATTSVYFDNLQLVRKDPGGAMPNPFQKEFSNAWSADMAVNSGKWFIGKENGVLVCKNMNPQDATQALLGHLQYERFQLACELKCLSDKYLYGPAWYIDDSNYFKVYIHNDLLTLAYQVGGIPGLATTAMSVVQNDAITFKVIKNGFSVFLVATKVTDINNPYFLSAELELAKGYPGLCSKPGVYSQISSYAVTKMAYSAYTGDGVDDYWKGQLSDRQCNVRFFGAKGDGVTDDTRAIQNAINYLNGLGGGTLVFPTGRYKVTSQITLCSNLMIDGCNSTLYADPATFLQRLLYVPDYSPGIAKTLSNDGTIGSFSVNVGDTNNLTAGDYILLFDNSVGGSHVHELLCIDSLIANSVTFTTALTYNYTTANGALIKKLSPTTNLEIRDLIIECSPSSDITQIGYFTNLVNARFDNIQVLNLRSITEHLIQYGFYLQNGLNVELKDCYFTNKSGNGFGMSIHGTSNLLVKDNKIIGFNFGIAVSRSEQAVIYGNQVKTTTSLGYGIYTHGCLHSTIDGNAVSGGYDTGFRIMNSGRCTVKNNSVVGAINAISLTNSSVDDAYECCHIVEGNIIEKSGYGIYISEGISKAIINGNLLKDINSYAIYINSGCSYTMIIGNMVVDSVNHGIFINSNHCIINNNTILNTVSVPIYSNVESLIISNNYIKGWGSLGGIRYYPKSSIIGNVLTNNDVNYCSLYCSADPLPNDGTALIGNISPVCPYQSSVFARLDAHSVNYGNVLWNVGQKTLHCNSSPTTGTFLAGDKVFYRVPTASAYIGEVCTLAGTKGTLNGGSTTGSITTGTNTLTVNNATGLVVGCYITINGVSGVKRVTGINGTTITIDSNANATVSNAAVAYSAPTMKGFGMVQA
jgi:parallel beta-helix repeat protein